MEMKDNYLSQVKDKKRKMVINVHPGKYKSRKLMDAFLN